MDHDPSRGKQHPLGFFSRSILVYRGVVMNRSWLDPWRESVGKTGMRNFHKPEIRTGFEDKPAYVQIPGFSSTSESFEVALEFC